MATEKKLKMEERSSFVTIAFPSEVGLELEAEMHDLTAYLKMQPKKLVLLDFIRVGIFKRNAYRPFLLLAQALKGVSVRVSTVNASEKLIEQVRGAGLESVFDFHKSTALALKAAGIAAIRPSMDVKFVNPFVKAVKNTLEIQARTKVEISSPYLKTADEMNEPVELAGIINLDSSVFKGSLVLSFPEKVFLKIYSNLLGETYTQITPEIADAVGEILNIIFGHAKAELVDKEGYKIREAIPTVIRGQQLKIHSGKTLPTIVLPFWIDAGIFRLEISAEPVEAGVGDSSTPKAA